MPLVYFSIKIYHRQVHLNGPEWVSLRNQGTLWASSCSSSVPELGWDTHIQEIMTSGTYGVKKNETFVIILGIISLIFLAKGPLISLIRA